MNRFLAAIILGGTAACVGCGSGRVSVPGPDTEAAGRIRATLVSASAGSAAAGGEAAATGTGWGSLKGRFT
ncbi:MAG: hypothetical protein ACKOHG_12195, partial [Planctomycetia bacterium]